MILKHRFNFFYVKFTSQDWDNGTARSVMEHLKALEKGSKSYLPNLKEWRVDKKKAPFALQEVLKINNDAIVNAKKAEAEDKFDDFDAVFGPKETI